MFGSVTHWEGMQKTSLLTNLGEKAGSAGREGQILGRRSRRSQCGEASCQSSLPHLPFAETFTKVSGAGQPAKCISSHNYFNLLNFLGKESI